MYHSVQAFVISTKVNVLNIGGD